MSRTDTVEVYTFDELDDDAKERPRQWWRDASAGDNYFAEHVEEDFRRVAEIIGVEVKDVAWSGFWSQGDGASFTGRYGYAKGSTEAIRSYAPLDQTLHRIADTLKAIQQRHFYKLGADITRGHLSNHYAHSRTMAIDVWHGDDAYRDMGDDADVIRELLIDLADWFYDQLEAAYEWENADEQVDENIRANEYDFTADGRRYAYA